MSEERGKTMTNVNRIVAENNKVVRYINGNSIAETYAKQEAHSAGVYISLTGNPEAICVTRINLKEDVVLVEQSQIPQAHK